jgi:hypothetical protein
MNPETFPAPYALEYEPQRLAQGVPLATYRIVAANGNAFASIPTHPDDRTAEFFQQAVEALNEKFAPKSTPAEPPVPSDAPTTQEPSAPASSKPSEPSSPASNAAKTSSDEKSSGTNTEPNVPAALDASDPESAVAATTSPANTPAVNAAVSETGAEDETQPAS